MIATLRRWSQALLFVMLTPQVAQPQEHAPVLDRVLVPVVRHDVYNGLPHNRILDIRQDAGARLWFATNNGLTRYNAREFLTLKKDALNPDSLPGNSINGLLPASDGALWLSLDELGLARVQPDTLDITAVPVDPAGREDALLAAHVFAAVEDARQRLWFFQYQSGVSVRDAATGRFVHHRMHAEDALDLGSGRFFDAETDGQTIWVVTLEGELIEIDALTLHSRVHRIPADARPGSLGLYDVHLAVGRTLVAGYKGVFEFDAHSGTFSELISEATLTAQFGRQVSVRRLLLDRQQRLWVATLQGLLLWQNGVLQAVDFYEKGLRVDSALYLQNLFQDTEGNVWLASDAQGAFKIPHNWNELSVVLAQQQNARKGQPLADVLQHHRADGDQLLISQAFAPDLLRYSYRDGALQGPEPLTLPNGVHLKVTAMAGDATDTLWLGTLSGLYRVDGGARIEAVPLQDAPIETVNRMHLQSSGDLLLHRFGEARLIRVPAGARRAEYLPDVRLRDESLIDLLPRPDGGLWLVSQSGIDRLSADFQELTPIHLSESTVQAIHMRPDGAAAWLALDHGVQLLQHSGAGWHPSTDRGMLQINALASRFQPTALMLDAQQRLWLGSQEGLLRIDLIRFDARQYTLTEGLPSNEVLSIHRLHDESVLVLTPAGLVHMPNREDSTALPRPSLVIDRVRINGQAHNSQPKNAPLLLSHDYGVLSFEYTLLSYLKPESHRFQYRLNAADAWIDAGTDHRQSFHALGDGDFLFQLRGKGNLGPWSDVQSVPFTVQPPFWKSWTAYALYFLTLALALFALMYLYRKRLHYTNEVRQAKEKRRFAENQLNLTSSLVKTLDIAAIFDHLTEQLQQQVPCQGIDMVYWHAQDQRAVYSNKHLSETQQTELLHTVHALRTAGDSHRLERGANGQCLSVLIKNAQQRIGLIQLHRAQGGFSDKEVILVTAYAMQSRMALENARLFEQVNELARQSRAASQAKSAFLAQVSHEVRTPMNGVLGMNELLMDTALDEEQQIYTRAIDESGHHLLNIINDILDLSKIEAGKLELEHKPMHLVNLCDQILNQFTAQSRNKKLLFYCDIDPRINPSRLGDALRVRQIIYNLLSNAFKFTHSGEISLHLEPHKNNLNRVCFRVKDSGIGIPADQIERVFEPFSQADTSTTRRFGGTGLGLSIVRQLVEKMRGTLRLHSQPGTGTRVDFSLDLPPDSEHPHTRTAGACTVGLSIRHPGLRRATEHALHWAGLTAVSGLHARADWFIFGPDGEDLQDALQWRQKTSVNTPLELLSTSGTAPAQQQLNALQPIEVLALPLTHQRLRAGAGRRTKGIEQHAEQSPDAHTQTSQRLHILVVEDHPINQQLVLDYLHDEDHAMEITDRANEALERLHLIEYDLLLTDHHLPDISGLELIARLRGQGLKLPVVVMTADVSTAVRRDLEKLGVEALLTKPFSRQQLHTAIRLALESTTV